MTVHTYSSQPLDHPVARRLSSEAYDTVWPTRSIDELLEVTFKDANIDHDRHPGLLRLIGARQDLT